MVLVDLVDSTSSREKEDRQHAGRNAHTCNTCCQGLTVRSVQADMERRRQKKRDKACSSLDAAHLLLHVNYVVIC